MDILGLAGSHTCDHVVTDRPGVVRKVSLPANTVLGCPRTLRYSFPLRSDYADHPGP